MKTAIDRFYIPQRQSRVAIGIILIKFVRVTVKTFWPILLSLFLGGRNNDSFQTVTGYLVLAIAAINLSGSLLTYFRFYFFLKNGEVIIDKGVLRRTKTNIPFERIQTINLRQNLLHRLFDVVSLEIDTAGAKKSELIIDALCKEDAESLRSFILKEKTQQAAIESMVEKEAKGEESSQTVLHLKLSDLFKVGISQNHLKSMALLFAFMLPILNQTRQNGEILLEYIVRLISGKPFDEEMVFNAGWKVLFASALIVLFVSLVYSLVRTVLDNYGLRLYVGKKGIKLVKGLLNRQECTVNKEKVQLIRWSDNLIRRVFSMFTLQIEQASSVDAGRLKSKIKVPGSYRVQVNAVVKAVFPAEYYREEKQHRPDKLLKNRLFLFLGGIPCALGLATFYYIQWQAFLFLIWGLFIRIIVSAYYNKRSFEVNDELLKNNRGTFGHIYELIQLYKVQAVQLRQSWYQRRKQLATVRLFTTAGAVVRIPFLPLKQAQALENFVLYRIESDKRQWM